MDRREYCERLFCHITSFSSFKIYIIPSFVYFSITKGITITGMELRYLATALAQVPDGL